VARRRLCSTSYAVGRVGQEAHERGRSIESNRVVASVGTRCSRVIKRAAKRAVRKAHADLERRTKTEVLEARAASRKRRRDERDEAALMAAAAKASRKCRGCGRWWRSNLTDQDWWTCEVCSAYTVCPKCDNAQARVERHESMCHGFEVPA